MPALPEQKAGANGQPTGPRCSFCNKEAGLVGLLIESPTFGGSRPAYICGPCVELCSSIIEQQKSKATAGSARDAEFLPDGPELAKEIARSLPKLSDLEQRVITLRYGLDGGYTYTLQDVARLLRMSPERVCEIETRAMVKIRR